MKLYVVISQDWGGSGEAKVYAIYATRKKANTVCRDKNKLSRGREYRVCAGEVRNG